MAELITDAQALSAASTEFGGIRSFFLFEDSASESRAGMQDTEKGVTGMFAMTGDAGGETAQKLASIWGGSGSEAYQGVQQRWDSTAADDAASSLGTSMGFTPPDDGFDFKAMEAGEASCSLKYNFGGIDGAASAVQGSLDRDGKDDLATYQPDTHDGGDAGLLFGDGGNGGIPATLAEWAVLLA